MDLILPDNLKPKRTEEKTMVPPPEIPVAGVTRGDIVKIGSELGVITIGDDLLKSLTDLGGTMETGGVARVANGLAYVSSASLTQLMLKMTQDALTVTDEKTREKIASTLARVANAIDKHNRTMKFESQGKGGGHPVGGPAKQASWRAHQHVHFHQHVQAPANAVAKEQSVEVASENGR